MSEELILVEKELKDLAEYIYSEYCFKNQVSKTSEVTQKNCRELITSIKFWVNDLTQSDEKTKLVTTIKELQSRAKFFETDNKKKSKKLFQLKNKLEDYYNKLQKAEEDREDMATYSQNLINEVKKDNLSMVNLLKVKEEHLEELKNQIETQKQVIKSQKEKIKKLPDIEKQLSELEKRYQIDMTKVKTKCQNEMSQSTKELKEFNKTKATNAYYEEKIKQLTSEVESYRRKFHKEVQLESRVKQYQELAASRTKSTQKLQVECNKLKVKLQDKNQEAQNLHKKNSALSKEVSELKRLKNPPKEEPHEPDIALVDLYKQKCREKDQHIQKLETRLSKMRYEETWHKRKEADFQSERKMLLDKIGELHSSNKSKTQETSIRPSVVSPNVSKEKSLLSVRSRPTTTVTRRKLSAHFVS